MAEFKTIETQEELDRIISDRLKRENDKHEKKIAELNQEITTLKDKVTAGEKTISEQQEKLNSHSDEVAKYTQEIDGYKRAQSKQRIAHEAGLPYEMAERLTGETEDDLKKDAESLKKFIATTDPPPRASSEVPPEEDKKSTYRDLAKEIRERI